MRTLTNEVDGAYPRSAPQPREKEPMTKVSIDWMKLAIERGDTLDELREMIAVQRGRIAELERQLPQEPHPVDRLMQAYEKAGGKHSAQGYKCDDNQGRKIWRVSAMDDGGAHDDMRNWRCTLGFHAWKSGQPRLCASRRCPRCHRQESVVHDRDTGSLNWHAAWGTDLSDRVFEVTCLPVMLLFMSPLILLMWLSDKLGKWLHDAPK